MANILRPDSKLEILCLFVIFVQTYFTVFQAISFGKSPDSNLRNFFPMFISRLTPECNKNLKAEVCMQLNCTFTRNHNSCNYINIILSYKMNDDPTKVCYMMIRF